MQLPDRRGRDEAVLTSKPVDGAAPPFDPAPDEPDHTPPARRRARWGGLGSRLRPRVLAAIAAGGALGGAARYGIQHALPAARDQFPWATFAVNVTGSLALAVLLVFVLEIWPPTRHMRPFAAQAFGVDQPTAQFECAGRRVVLMLDPHFRAAALRQQWPRVLRRAGKTVVHQRQRRFEFGQREHGASDQVG